MRKIMMWFLTFAVLLLQAAVAKNTPSARNAIQVASTSVVVPSVANVTGLINLYQFIQGILPDLRQ